MISMSLQVFDKVTRQKLYYILLMCRDGIIDKKISITYKSIEL